MLKLVRYSLLMVLAPLASFYFSFYVVFNQDKSKLMWCGIIAVIATNLVIASYVIMAWNEKDEESGAETKRGQLGHKSD